MIYAFFKVWSVTTGVFLVGDVLWLTLVMNKFFVPQIKHLMDVTSNGTRINYPSALIAYLLVSVALVWFVVMPFGKQPLMTVFLHGALLGFCLYGVYEFTNHATLISWPLSFLAIDVLWGTVWCGVASAISVALINYFKI